MQLCSMGELCLSLNGLLQVDPASCFCTDCPGPAQHVVACYTLQQGASIWQQCSSLEQKRHDGTWEDAVWYGPPYRDSVTRYFSFCSLRCLNTMPTIPPVAPTMPPSTKRMMHDSHTGACPSKVSPDEQCCTHKATVGKVYMCFSL
jgi:hypothetical protein